MNTLLIEPTPPVLLSVFAFYLFIFLSVDLDSSRFLFSHTVLRHTCLVELRGQTLTGGDFEDSTQVSRAGHKSLYPLSHLPALRGFVWLFFLFIYFSGFGFGLLL